MAQQTVESLVEQLRKQGHKIKYRKRSQGGILVTEIDGQKYTGAHGNAVVRTMTGTVLSEKRAAQLKSITPIKKRAREKAKKLKIPKVKDVLGKEIEATKEAWRIKRELDKKLKKPKIENGKKKKAKGGYISQVTMQKAFNRHYHEAIAEGKTHEEAIQQATDKVRKSLMQSRRYAEGYAYAENIDAFILRLTVHLNQGMNVQPSIDKIKEKNYEISEKQLEDMIQAYYDDLQYGRVKEFNRKVIAILSV